MAELAYVALGANLGDPRSMFETATLRLIQRGVRVLRRARVYASRPVGPSDQPDFLNSMLEIEPGLPPEQLLSTLKAIERQLGREKTIAWGPRVIDLDIILFGAQQIATDRLTIPHREMANRRFVLAPLADLCPNRIVPGSNRTVSSLLAALGRRAPNDGLEVCVDRIETYALPRG